MEVVGLTIGVVGLAGLFSVCQAAIEQIDTYRNFENESRSIKAQFELSKQIFQLWAKDVGLKDTTTTESHHPNLNDPRTASTVAEALRSISDIFDVTIDTSSTLQPDLSDNNQSSSTTAPKIIPSRFKHYKPLQASRKDKIEWMLRGRNKIVKKVEIFGDLVTKLYTLVPPEQTGSRPDGRGTSFKRRSL